MRSLPWKRKAERPSRWRTQTDNAVVFQAIENLYADPRGRAKALKAMGRSFDRRFAAYPPQHLDDPDPRDQAPGHLGRRLS